MIKRTAFSIVAGAMLLVSPTASAEDINDLAMKQALQVLDSQFPGKLINNPYNIQWKTEGSDKKEAVVDAPGIPGGMAYSVRVKKKKRKVWDTATRLPMTESIEKGDVIKLSFWARAAKPRKGHETGKIGAAIQRNVEPYDSIFSETIEPTTEWKLYSAMGKAGRDYNYKKTNLNFNLAYAKQTIEFGQFYITNLGPDAEVE